MTFSSGRFRIGPVATSFFAGHGKRLEGSPEEGSSWQEPGCSCKPLSGIMAYRFGHGALAAKEVYQAKELQASSTRYQSKQKSHVRPVTDSLFRRTFTAKASSNMLAITAIAIENDSNTKSDPIVMIVDSRARSLPKPTKFAKLSLLAMTGRDGRLMPLRLHQPGSCHAVAVSRRRLDHLAATDSLWKEPKTCYQAPASTPHSASMVSSSMRDSDVITWMLHFKSRAARTVRPC
jgi:hypothetical protein